MGQNTLPHSRDEPLKVDGDRITKTERLLHDRYGRIRDIVRGPDGYLYVLTDEVNGQLLRLRPG